MKLLKRITYKETYGADEKQYKSVRRDEREKCIGKIVQERDITLLNEAIKFKF